jgi:hypothetical protein
VPDAKATFQLVGEDATAAAFRSALGATQAFAAKAQDLLKGAFALGGAMIAVDFVKSIADLGENLQKGAERAGIAQANFNQLAAAFGVADVSAESLSKGIKNMQVALSKAADGDGSIAAIFNSIGLSAVSLKQQAPDVQLLSIAEALSKIEDPADRARIGTQLLGKQFLELEPQLLKGAAGLDAVVQAAHGMSDEDTERLSKFSQQMNSIGQSLKLFAAGAVAGTVNSFGQLKDIFTPDLAAKIKTIQDALANPGNFDESTLSRMRTQLAGLQAQVSQVSKPSENFMSAMAEQGKGNIEALARSLLMLSVHEDDLDAALALEKSKRLDQEDKDTQTHAEKRLDVEAKIDDLLVEKRITQIEAFRRLYDQDITNSNAALSRNAMAENAKDVEDAWKQTEDSLKQNFANIGADSKLATENMKADFDKTASNAKQAAQSIEDSFATFLVDPFSGGLKKMLASWIQTIDQMVAKAAAQSIFKSLFGDTPGGLGGVFSNFLSGQYGASTSVTYNGGGDPVPGALGQVPGYATGGSFNVGGSGGTDSQLVRFKATPGEKVTVSRPGQSAGGVTVVNHNYIDARSDSAQIAQMIGQSTQYAIQQSTARVVDMVKRGRFTSG